MSLSIYEASVPVFRASLADMRAWLDKPEARQAEADLLEARPIPNFFFHATTAYAILRASGVPVGKPDFLQHLGPPNLVEGS